MPGWNILRLCYATIAGLWLVLNSTHCQATLCMDLQVQVIYKHFKLQGPNWWLSWCWDNRSQCVTGWGLAEAFSSWGSEGRENVEPLHQTVLHQAHCLCSCLQTCLAVCCSHMVLLELEASQAHRFPLMCCGPWGATRPQAAAAGKGLWTVS